MTIRLTLDQIASILEDFLPYPDKTVSIEEVAIGWHYNNQYHQTRALDLERTLFDLFGYTLSDVRFKSVILKYNAELIIYTLVQYSRHVATPIYTSLPLLAILSDLTDEEKEMLIKQSPLNIKFINPTAKQQQLHNMLYEI